MLQKEIRVSLLKKDVKRIRSNVVSVNTQAHKQGDSEALPSKGVQQATMRALMKDKMRK